MKRELNGNETVLPRCMGVVHAREASLQSTLLKVSTLLDK